MPDILSINLITTDPGCDRAIASQQEATSDPFSTTCCQNEESPNNNTSQPREPAEVPPFTPDCSRHITNIETPSPHQRSVKIVEDMEESFGDGHNSNGELGPFYDAILEEGPQDYDIDDHSIPLSITFCDDGNGQSNENGVTEIMTEAEGESIVESNTLSNTPLMNFVDIPHNEIDSFKVDWLKKELKMRG